MNAKQAEMGVWRPIETAPKDGTWILIAGPSGYSTTPLRAEVARYYPAYRPLNPWQNHGNDSFTDGGQLPTHWHPLPFLQADELDAEAESDSAADAHRSSMETAGFADHK